MTPAKKVRALLGETRRYELVLPAIRTVTPPTFWRTPISGGAARVATLHAIAKVPPDRWRYLLVGAGAPWGLATSLEAAIAAAREAWLELRQVGVGGISVVVRYREDRPPDALVVDRPPSNLVAVVEPTPGVVDAPRLRLGTLAAALLGIRDPMAPGALDGVLRLQQVFERAAPALTGR